MKPPVKFLSFVLGITSLLSLIFLILSPQTSTVALETTAPPSLDFDGSGIVDFPDFLMFVNAFGSEDGQDKYEAKYDLNRDGKIAFEDLLIFTDNFGKSVVAQKPPTPPIPPTPSGQGTAPPDLIVESPKVSDSSPDAGASFTLSATVRNQ
ncbi:MAG: dockerin type I domain-containing protein, partial [Gemmatimonadetes bacterium]|nr:dockerin type I domain-containing protein [Gemmatimonadota bacterium]